MWWWGTCDLFTNANINICTWELEFKSSHTDQFWFHFNKPFSVSIAINVISANVHGQYLDNFMTRSTHLKLLPWALELRVALEGLIAFYLASHYLLQEEGAKLQIRINVSDSEVCCGHCWCLWSSTILSLSNISFQTRKITSKPSQKHHIIELRNVDPMTWKLGSMLNFFLRYTPPLATYGTSWYKLHRTKPSQGQKISHYYLRLDNSHKLYFACKFSCFTSS